MGKHKCFVYMRVGTASQIVDERGKPHENLAQITTNEKAARGVWPIQGCMVVPDGSLLGVQRRLHCQQSADPHSNGYH